MLFSEELAEAGLGIFGRRPCAQIGFPQRDFRGVDEETSRPGSSLSRQEAVRQLKLNQQVCLH